MCFCVNDNYFYCPNFWAIKLEILLHSTASIEFNCYFQLQQCSLLLESTAKAGDAVLCSHNTRQQRSSRSGWWTSTECSSGTMNLLLLSYPMPPSCGETVTTNSQALWTTKTLSRRLLGTAGVLASIKRGCVLIFKMWWGTWALCRGRVLLWIRPVPAQAGELHTIFKWQTSPWKEMHTWAYWKHVNLRLFTDWE